MTSVFPKTQKNGIRFMRNKKILIFGGSGSLGCALINELVEENDLLVYSRDEAKHWALKNKFNHESLRFHVGDIRDLGRVESCINNYNPHIIIIASALKHVDVCEKAPSESVLTNIIGPQNVADSSERASKRLENRLETVLMVSTDKACSPINVYGLCKGLAEKIVLEKSRRGSEVKFLAVRYGNVLESRGSIIPLFHYQGLYNEQITITHPSMTRFLMTLPESVGLIQRALIYGSSGETFIPKLKAMKIEDLANIFSKLYNKSIKEVGLRVGEKIHESLVNDTEALRMIEGKEDYIIKSIFDDTIFNNTPCDYNSGLKSSLVSEKELYAHLNSLGMLEKNIDKFEEAEGAKYSAIRKTNLRNHNQ